MATVNLTNPFFSGTAGADNVYGTAGRDEIHGGDGNDNLRGGAGDDVLYGDAGNDQLDGGVGADEMLGGIGDDTYVVDNENDIIIEFANEGKDHVKSYISYTLGANVENLTLIGSDLINATGNELGNTLRGNSSNNVLSGLAGNDSLDGGDGDDILVGGTGTDWLLGGNGSDEFRFDRSDIHSSRETDSIQDLDFSQGDTIKLTGYAAGVFLGKDNDGNALDLGPSEMKIDSYADIAELVKNGSALSVSQKSNSGSIVLTITDSALSQVITITDPTGSAWQKYQQALVDYDKNLAPVLSGDAHVTGSVGAPLRLTLADLNATDDSSLSELTFVASNMVNGLLKVDDVETTTFTFEQLRLGQVSFEPNGGASGSFEVAAVDIHGARSTARTITTEAITRTATTIDFEDLEAGNSLPTGYAGFNWTDRWDLPSVVVDPATVARDGTDTTALGKSSVLMHSRGIDIERADGAEFEYNGLSTFMTSDSVRRVVINGYNDGQQVFNIQALPERVLSDGPSVSIDRLEIRFIGNELIFDNLVLLI